MRNLIALLLVTLQLTACSSARKPESGQQEPIRPPLTSSTSTTPEVKPQTPFNQAIALYDSGNWPEAIKALVAAVPSVTPDESIALRLRLADALLQSGSPISAYTLLDKVQPTPATAPEMRLLYLIMQAERELERNPQESITVLNRPLPTPLNSNSPLLPRYHLTKANAYHALKQPIPALRAYIERGLSLKVNSPLANDNHESIWYLLNQLPPNLLNSYPQRPAQNLPDKLIDNQLNQWIEVAKLSQQYASDSGGLKRALNQWKQRNNDHPLNDLLIEKILKRRQQSPLTAAQIAVLLPLSGNLAQVGQAVQEGILAAYYNDTQQASRQLQFYDTQGSVSGGEAALKSALNYGADTIIGPLNKEVVDHVIALIEKEAKKPQAVLTLNRNDKPLPQGVYAFSLAPEDEARDSARRAALEGFTRALMLLPNNPLGRRIGEQFRQDWIKLGGVVVEDHYYDTNKNDFTDEITSLLNIDESNERARQLKSLLGERFEFTPRRRQDGEFLFLAAYPREARLIRPQLQFHHAGGLPIIATSHLFNGQINSDQDQDINGVFFGDMPWILHPELSRSPYPPQLQDRHSGTLQRLVAMGIDAYQILPKLPLLENNPHENHDGVTGRLRLNLSRQIERELSWARFSEGVPRPVVHSDLVPENLPAESDSE
ncbi:MAG: penicillin-binding protein activator [Gammaproteobacteria bacterium]|nr:penicillin-binding protein activator [Gammaproteobacteria bacterium]